MPIAAKRVVGHRIAGQRPLSAFAPSPKHLRGPRKAVPGKAVPGKAVPGKAVPGKAVPGMTGPGQAAPAHARPLRLTAGQRAESAALSRAEAIGKPVVVAAEMTPTVEVVAHPTGLLSMTSNVFPVRVKVRGAWRAINPALRRTADGAWAASAASVPVVFSGGGNGPLVTVADSAGQKAALYWPAALPRPRVKGSVALYRHVLPGVDLRMEATGTGYQEALVVRDAAAAANPRLRSLSYRVRAGNGMAYLPENSVHYISSGPRESSRILTGLKTACPWQQRLPQQKPGSAVARKCHSIATRTAHGRVMLVAQAQVPDSQNPLRKRAPQAADKTEEDRTARREAGRRLSENDA